MAQGSSFSTFGRFAAVVIIISLALAGKGDNQLMQISGCVCAGYNVTFTCSIVGGGNTIWNGTAFNCPSGNSVSDNQIFLRHSGFDVLTSGMCNDGAIIGEAVSVENTRYTSRLSVRVESDIVGKNISCIYDDTTRGMEILIGTTTIELTSGDELSQPSNISLVGVSPSELIFKWSSVTHNCSAIIYSIMMTSPGCGNCPMIVNSPSTTCFINQLQENEVRTCIFRVQGVLCGNISGPFSEANFRLQVPGAPTISVIPTYSQQNDSLLKIVVSFPEMSLLPFSNSGSSEISSSPTSYFVYYRNTSDYVCDSDTILPAINCEDGECSREFDVTLTSCYPFNQIAVAVFAANLLGNGSMSNSIATGSVNSFVRITYDVETTGVTFFCRFLNPQDMTDISCSIKYVQCQRKALTAPKQLNATSTGVPNVLQIVLTFDESGEAYCYSIEAANASYIVHVDGTLNFEDANMLSGGAIGGITVGIFIVVALVIILLLSVSWKVVTKRTEQKPTDLEDVDLTELNFDTDDLKIVDPKQFKLYDVDKDCKLGSFMAKSGLHYNRIGSVYYEFSRKEEIITEDKDIILMNIKTQKKFRSERMREIIGAPDNTSGSEVTLKPSKPGYKVFVQSKGIGYRPLDKGTKILYDISPPTDSPDSGSNGSEDLIPVTDNRFLILDVKKPCKLYKFISKTHGKRYEPGCAFFEFTSATEDIGIEKEVILIKKSTEKLFTGRKALHMVGGPGAGISKPDELLQDWRVFIQSKHLGARHLEAGTQVLYQEPKCAEEQWIPVDDDRFIKLDVDTVSRLDTFVIKRRQLEYKSECFFFEFLADDIEMITDDQEVVIMNEMSEKLFSGAEVKKAIGAPAQKVRGTKLEGYRVFIQNVGAGSRSLESGTCLLYDHAKAQLP